jgi:hypothetical protein
VEGVHDPSIAHVVEGIEQRVKSVTKLEMMDLKVQGDERTEEWRIEQGL